MNFDFSFTIILCLRLVKPPGAESLDRGKRLTVICLEVVVGVWVEVSPCKKRKERVKKELHALFSLSISCYASTRWLISLLDRAFGCPNALFPSG